MTTRLLLQVFCILIFLFFVAGCCPAHMLGIQLDELGPILESNLFLGKSAIRILPSLILGVMFNTSVDSVVAYGHRCETRHCSIDVHHKCWSPVYLEISSVLRHSNFFFVILRVYSTVR